MDEKLLKEIEFLLFAAEQLVWKKADHVMTQLYWDIGHCLRELKEEELRVMSHVLSKELNVEARLFETAYYFYRGNPIKKKALEAAA